ncbi:alpha-galactosidase [candidate division KSB1 bacterium]|nr:alpha-galactosidase [candidate division KSB1 bacterium]
MAKLSFYAIAIIWILACENPSPIHYKKADGVIYFENKSIKLAIDDNMKITTSYFNGEEIKSMVVDQSSPNDFLVIYDKEVKDFKTEKSQLNELNNEFGLGKQLKIFGKATVMIEEVKTELEKVLTIELYDNFPNTAVTYVEYTNLSENPVKIDKVVNVSYTVDRKLLDPTQNSYEFSLFQGCGVDWGLDYANIKIGPEYSATNFIGITIAHRDPPGGGIPLLDLWSKEMGMAIAHISDKPEFVNLPIQTLPDGRVKYAIEEPYSQQYEDIILANSETFSTIKCVVIVHSLDYFDALRTYAEFLNAQGIKTFKETPANVPNAYWKTWGYELDFKLKDIYAKVPEFKELGIEMVVLDDGWFSNYGDWEPSTEKDKFPEGRKSLTKFVSNMHDEGLDVGIWWCPLIVEPHSEAAKANADWFMQQKDGQPYVMKDPTSYYLCPDYAPVLNFWEEQIEKLYSTFDLDFIYHDWANLIEVPPCYNPLHKHESPLSPYWNFGKQYKVMYDKAQSIKPGYAIEMCECGRPHDPYKMPFYNITNASDANNKEQVRQRLKVEKALNGSKVYFNPGYILPESKADWGYDPCEIDECVAMGGYFESYYTELTPEKKKEWLKWMKIYKEEAIYKGEYLNLYDVANDLPEFHVTKKDDNLYYFAPGPFKGEAELRGLDNKSYTIIDFSSNETITTVNGPVAKVNIDVESDIYLKATASIQ